MRLPLLVFALTCAPRPALSTEGESSPSQAPVLSTAPSPPRSALGFVLGLSYSPRVLERSTLRRTGSASLAWGFFVDIHLLDVFYLSPSSTIYNLDLGEGAKPTTDMSLNTKLLIPFANTRLGGGFTMGVTTGGIGFGYHWGGLASFSYVLIRNVELCLLLQYKMLLREEERTIHNLLGTLATMLRF